MAFNMGRSVSLVRTALAAHGSRYNIPLLACNTVSMRHNQQYCYHIQRPFSNQPARSNTRPVSGGAALTTSHPAPVVASTVSNVSHGTSSISHNKNDDHGYDAGDNRGSFHDDADYNVHIGDPSRWHVIGGQVFGGLLWFWILYRLKNDWKYFLFLENPFDSAYAPTDTEAAEHH